MDPDSSTKFIGSLTKFLQSLCNGYVEFEDGVELIGHIYLSVDTGKKGKKIDYILNEKVCKSDNSVTFISNSFHALPDKAKRDEGEISDAGDAPRSTNTGTVPSRSQQSRSAPSPNQRSGVQAGTKRPGSPLKGPQPTQRRAHSPPSQRRLQSSATRPPSGSPASKTVPSSPSSSSQDNIPSPSPGKKGRSETVTSEPPSNQSDNADLEDIPPNVLSINPTPDFASFLGSLTSDNQSSHKSPRDTKPDTDVTFIKEEFVSEPSSCAQAGNSGHSGRSGDEDGLYPVMLHQNTSVFPGASAGYPPGFSSNVSSTATSQSAFPGLSTSQSDMFNPVPGTSQDGADPSVHGVEPFAPEKKDQDGGAGNDTSNSVDSTYCNECDKQIGNRTAFSRHMLKVHENSRPYHCFKCGTKFTQVSSLNRHKLSCENPRRLSCHICGLVFNRADTLNDHLKHKHKPLSFYESQAKASETPGLELDAQCDGITGLSLSAVTIHKTPTPYPCSKCNKSFKALSSLNRHKLSCDNNLVVVCHICGRGFHRKDYLEAHLKGQHKRSKIDNYYCNQCGEAFQFKSLMIAHKGKCQDFFSVNQTYKQEEIKKAQPEEVKDSVITKNAYQSEGTSCTYCTTCEMQFSNCTAYGQHMRCVHNVARPYTCSNCGKCFMQMSSLTRHKVGCENRRVVFCHVCGRGFHRKDYLNDHLKGKHKRNSHLSYFCRNCGKGFQYKSWLFTHKAKCEYVASTSQTSEKEEAFHDPQNLDSTPIMK